MTTLLTNSCLGKSSFDAKGLNPARVKRSLTKPAASDHKSIFFFLKTDGYNKIEKIPTFQATDAERNEL